MSEFLRDLRFGARLLAKSPGLAATAVGGDFAFRDLPDWLDQFTQHADVYATGAASSTAGSTAANFSKLLLKRALNAAAARSYADLSCHMPRGSRTAAGTFGQLSGTRTLNTGCGVMGTRAKSPESAAFSITRVYASFILWPTP